MAKNTTDAQLGGHSESITEDDMKVADEFFKLLKEDTARVKDLSPEKLYSIQLGAGGSLLSAKAFEEMNLKKELLNTVYKIGIEKPSTIQQLAIPHILTQKNAVFQSRSGTGKTIAFTLGCLNAAVPGAGPQIIVLTPTRELCNQVSSVIEDLARYVDLRVCRLLSNVVSTVVEEEIVVGCPGRVKTYLDKKWIKPAAIKMLIMDEADVLISYQSFSVQTVSILKYLNKAQKVLFSATYSDFSKLAIDRFLPVCNTFFEENAAARQIKFYCLEFGAKQKIEALKELFSYITVAQIIIFCNRRETVETVAAAFAKEQYSVSIIHGKMDPASRDESFIRFSQAKTKVLVTTDVFSRGMDIAQVNLIINFDLPFGSSGADENPVNTYIHRVGRSGRFDRSGFVVDLYEDGEFAEHLKSIQDEASVVSKSLKLIALRKVFEKHELTYDVL